MKNTILLIFAALLFNLIVKAQEKLPFEKQKVVLTDGTEKLLWISLDEKADLLHYKPDENSKPENYNPSDVVSFEYANQQYYSLPMRDGYFTFFKVYHEGQEYAVLEKSPSYKALRVIAEESNGEYSFCQNSINDKFYLCYRDSNTFGSGSRTVYNQAFYGSYIRKFVVDKIVYLAIEGKLKLFYLETDERLNPFDNGTGARPGRYKTEEMLSKFIEDEQKIKTIQKKVKKNKLDIRFPPHLVIALESVYH
ncbi:hypothetical protein [Cesiribacter sp. SM1]|uniref:hypothetical protein n=1 Tax=Cesiribacter sp. SM1 TaxID=2861196 RepID=UPI001CD66360|nr:hypothetical protein [Cesiribacter sp. SM1]